MSTVERNVTQTKDNDGADEGGKGSNGSTTTRLKRDGCVTVCAGSLDTQRVHVPCVLECVI